MEHLTECGQLCDCLWLDGLSLTIHVLVWRFSSESLAKALNGKWRVIWDRVRVSDVLPAFWGLSFNIRPSWFLKRIISNRKKQVHHFVCGSHKAHWAISSTERRQVASAWVCRAQLSQCDSCLIFHWSEISWGKPGWYWIDLKKDLKEYYTILEHD